MWSPAVLVASFALLATVSVPVVGAVDRAGPAGRQPPAAGRSVGRLEAAGPVLRADVVVRHRRVTSAGVPIGLPRPDVALRVERLERRGRWVTVVSRIGEPPVFVEGLAGREALTNPFHVARVELADDETRPQMFDRAGRPVRNLAPGDLAMVRAAALAPGGDGPSGRQVTAGWLVPPTESATDRRAMFVERYGVSTGRVRGYDRYVTTTAAGRHEVLVTTDTALPAEVHARLAGGAEMHTGIEYAPVAGYGLMRRRLRSDLRLPGNAGRVTTEVEITGIHVETGVQP